MEKKEYENIGDYIRRIRNEKGISINELVKQSGVSKGYISQIENNKFSPSLDIVRKLSNALDTDFYELAWRAGLYTDEEIEEVRYKRNYYDSMTPEEEAAYFERENQEMLIEEYRKQEYPDVKELLSQSTVFFGGKSLNNENRELAVKMLELLFEKLEVDYPSEQKIEKEYVNHKKYLESMNNMFNNLKTE